MGTLISLLDRAAAQFGPRPALLFRPRYRTEVWTYERLAAVSGQIAAWLGGRGIEPMDRVALWSTNSPWWVAAFFGALRLGAVVVPLDVRSSPDFVRRVLDQTQPKLAFLSQRTMMGWDSTIPATPLEELEQVLLPVETIITSGPEPDDLAEVMFTSGTTGDPKGVRLTHGNISSNVEAVYQVFPSRSHHRLLSLLPLSHMLEQTVGLFLPLRGGASIYYARSTQPSQLFRDLREEGITNVVLVPQALGLLLSGIEAEVRRRGKEASWQRLQRLAALLPRQGRRFLFHSIHQELGGRLSFLVSGGAPLDPALARRWELLGIPILQGYGTTEASPVITGTTFGERDWHSVGRPVPGVKVHIAPDGEILVRGPNVTAGYWNNSEATAQAFEAGWYKTGDLGTLDNAGRLHLRGRKKDLIVLADGQNVYAEDVERALNEIAGVVEAVVLGLPGPRGQQVHAVLRFEPDAPAPAMIIRQANSHLADHQQVMGWTVWPDEDFPRTHTLKVRKQEILRAVLARQNASAAPESRAPQERTVEHRAPLFRLLGEVAGLTDQEIAAEKTLGELGLDSLGRVEALAAIEAALGVFVDEARVGPDTTVAELDVMIGAGLPAQRQSLARWPLSPAANAARRALQVIPLALLPAVAPTRVTGQEHLQGLRPPVLFVANHTSHLDAPTLVRALPGRWRRTVAVAAAADYFFRDAVIGAGAALLLNAFPFSRDATIRPTLEHCAWLLDHGWSILLFPEGTRSTTGQMAEFKDGAGLLAVELAIPVVPVYLGGLYAILPKGRGVPRRAPVRVAFGPASRFDRQTPYHEATLAMEAAVRRLATGAAPE